MTVDIINPEMSKKYEPSRRLTSFHIRGFQHWDGALVLNELKVGEKLELVAEPDNPFDPEAVAVYSCGAKLGYVPSDENSIFATMFHYGHEGIFEARIMQVAPEADPWQQVRMGIYVVDARYDKLAESSGTKSMETPNATRSNKFIGNGDKDIGFGKPTGLR